MNWWLREFQLARFLITSDRERCFKVLCVLHFIFVKTTQALGIIFSGALCVLKGSSAGVDHCVVMGNERGVMRMLLECSLSDKLCSKYR